MKGEEGREKALEVPSLEHWQFVKVSLDVLARFWSRSRIRLRVGVIEGAGIAVKEGVWSHLNKVGVFLRRYSSEPRHEA